MHEPGVFSSDPPMTTDTVVVLAKDGIQRCCAVKLIAHFVVVRKGLRAFWQSTTTLSCCTEVSWLFIFFSSFFFFSMRLSLKTLCIRSSC